MFSKNDLIFLGAALIWAGERQKCNHDIIFRKEDDGLFSKDRKRLEAQGLLENFYADDKIDAAIKESKAIFDKVFSEEN